MAFEFKIHLSETTSWQLKIEFIVNFGVFYVYIYVLCCLFFFACVLRVSIDNDMCHASLCFLCNFTLHHRRTSAFVNRMPMTRESINTFCLYNVRVKLHKGSYVACVLQRHIAYIEFLRQHSSSIFDEQDRGSQSIVLFAYHKIAYAILDHTHSNSYPTRPNTPHTLPNDRDKQKQQNTD